MFYIKKETVHNIVYFILLFTKVDFKSNRNDMPQISIILKLRQNRNLILMKKK